VSVIVRRSAGFCMNVKCRDYAKGIFVLGANQGFFCSVCKLEGKLVSEGGRTALYDGHIINEVRVEYNYCPATEVYREIAVVRDESIGSGGTYVFQSPLIMNEKRAFKVAEYLIVNVNLGTGVHSDSVFREHLLNFDDPREVFAAKAEALLGRMAANPFFKETNDG
jgi:hypothetical protein